VAAVLGRRDLYEQGALRYGEVAGQNPRLILVGGANGGLAKRA